MTTCHSNKAENVIDSIRSTLMNYDLEIERVSSQVSFYKEVMKFNGSGTSKKAQKDFIDAKINKENYEVFLYRLKVMKKNLLKRVELVLKKYQGAQYKVFSMYFINKKEPVEIARVLDMTEKQVLQLVSLMKEDILSYCSTNKKKRV